MSRINSTASEIEKRFEKRFDEQEKRFERKLKVVTEKLKSITKDLKELRFKLSFRQGLTMTRDREGLAKAVYGDNENAKRRDRNTLPKLHKVAHMNYGFPRKTDQEYADASAHLKHRDSPGPTTSSVYKKGQTANLRRFKTVVNRGHGVTWGGTAPKTTATRSDATGSNARQVSDARTSAPHPKRKRR